MIYNEQLYGDLFDAIDRNKDGKISTSEFIVALTQIGIDTTPDSVQSIFTLIDDTFDGQLRLNEFYHFMYIFQNADVNDPKSILFLAADLDHSGYISAEEFHKILGKLGFVVEKRYVEELFQSVADVQGELSYSVFKIVMDKIHDSVKKIQSAA